VLSHQQMARTLTPQVLVRIQVPRQLSIPAFVARRKRLTAKFVCAAQNVPRKGVTVFGSRAASDHGVRSAEFEALKP
jgi:hypothetical protein